MGYTLGLATAKRYSFWYLYVVGIVCCGWGRFLLALIESSCCRESVCEVPTIQMDWNVTRKWNFNTESDKQSLMQIDDSYPRYFPLSFDIFGIVVDTYTYSNAISHSLTFTKYMRRMWLKDVHIWHFAFASLWGGEGQYFSTCDRHDLPCVPPRFTHENPKHASNADFFASIERYRYLQLGLDYHDQEQTINERKHKYKC